jgi:hypothetical protein
MPIDFWREPSQPVRFLMEVSVGRGPQAGSVPHGRRSLPVLEIYSSLGICGQRAARGDPQTGSAQANRPRESEQA